MIHLHCHTKFSTGDALPSPAALVKAAGEGSVLAITDHNTMGGMVEFSRECRRGGVKPIFGTEIDMDDDSRLTLLAASNRGLVNLFYLLSSQRTYDDLHRFSKDIVCLTGDLKGAIPTSIIKDDDEETKRHVRRLHEIFGRDLYLEVINHGLREQKKVNETYRDWVSRSKMKLVTTNDVHYLTPEDAKYQAALICDRLKRMMNVEWVNYHLNKEAWLKDLPYDPVAVEIAEKCNASVESDDTLLPHYNIPDGFRSPNSYLKFLALEGLKSRGKHVPEYKERLDFELGIIDTMGFSGYFLIVWDFIAHAKKIGVPVGPGRGSGAGSLVAYCLQITDIDPIAHKLLFERFLNPERVSMPDFDIDFGQERRGEVIEYVVNKYGDECVCQINTFSELKPRAAWKAASRVIGVSHENSEVISSKLPDTVNVTNTKISLNDLFEDGHVKPDAPAGYDVLKKFFGRNEKFRQAMEIAQNIEGGYRSLGKHAAGVLIADKAINNYIPVWNTNGHAGAFEDIEDSPTKYISQLQYTDAESLGLVKFDFLGLKELEVVEYTLRLIREQGFKVPDVSEIENITDEKTFELVATGRTQGIFQISSEGLSQFMKLMKATCFEDIVAALALYRPGPMDYEPRGMHLEYADRKNGLSRVEYAHPDLEGILGDTYGVIVYQEQVMQIAQQIAGYTLGGADILRRAMGKKKKEEMDRQYDVFMSGGRNKGYSDELLQELWNQIMTFARYGFNRSHAAAYGKITYQTAFLKAHHTPELLAAQMQVRHEKADEISVYIRDALEFGIDIQEPDVRVSPHRFDVREGRIRVGLCGVRSLGGETALRIQQCQPFDSVMDVFLRAQLNKTDVDALIGCGAFDGLMGAKTIEEKCQARADLEYWTKTFLKYAKNKKQSADQFEMFPSMLPEVIPNSTSPWTPEQLFAKELEFLGRYVSGHPIELYRHKAKRIGITKIEDIEEVDQKYMIIAIVKDVREWLTQKQDQMCFLKLEDETGELDVTVFPSDYVPGFFHENQILYFYVQTQEYNDSMSAILKNTRRP